MKAVNLTEEKIRTDMQELEKILEEIEKLRGQVGSECTSEDHYIKKAWEHCLDRVEYIIRKHMNDGWIPVEDGLPEDETDVLVVLKPTYESDYIEYSIARYLRFENDEAHWCDNHYGYLEWEKYSDGHGGSSWHRVVAWQKLDSYHTERSDSHDGE